MAYNTAIVRGNRNDIQTNIKTVLDTLTIAPGTMPNTIITKTGADNFIAVITYEMTAGASTPPLPSGAATAAKQLPDGHNVSVNNMIPSVETGLAKSANQLPNDHDVNVSNMIPAVETGLSTSANQTNGNQLSQVTMNETKNNTQQAPSLDASTLAIKMIDYEHSEIHNGSHYFNVDYVDLANGATRQIVIAASDSTKWVHFFFTVEFEKETLITLTEDISTDADGTPMGEFNNNRNSVNNADLVLTHTPTNPAGGTVIWQERKGDGKKSGGVTRASEEIVLDQGKKYLLTITNASTSDNLVNWHMHWYEHIDKV